MTSEFVTLKSLAHVITKGTTPTKAQGYTDDGINFIRALSIDENGQLDEETFLKISNETNDDLKRSIVQEGDVLYTIAGVIGRVTVVEKKHLPANLNQALAIIRPKKDKISSRYLANLLRSHDAQFYLKSRVVESVQANLSLGELGRFPVEKLPLAAQNNRIKSLELIEDKSRSCSLISDISENLISSLFRSWFIDFDPVKAKSEGKLPYGMDEETAALFPDSFEDSELGPIPTGWRVFSISEICKMSSGGTPSRSKDEYFSTQGVGYPWLASRELNGNIIHDAEEYISELGLKNSSAKLLPENSVAMAMYGATAGRIGYFAKPLTTSQAICVMLAKVNICLPKYLYFLIRSESWKIVWMNALGGAQPNISQQSIGKHRIVLPPFEIIQKFESLVDELFTKIDSSSIQSEKLSEIRNALLPRLMSGELEVPMEA